MTTTLLPAAGDQVSLSWTRTWLTSQLQPYLAELSAFTEIGRDADGHYNYPYLDHYWREPDRHPFIILKDDDACGFVLVRQDLDPSNGNTCMEIAEIYVLPAYRGYSVAGNAVRQVVTFFQGSWRASVLRNNRAAYAFWVKTISSIDVDYQILAPEPKMNNNFVFRFNAPDE